MAQAEQGGVFPWISLGLGLLIQHLSQGEAFAQAHTVLTKPPRDGVFFPHFFGCLHVQPLKTTKNTNWEQSHCSLVVNYSVKSCKTPEHQQVQVSTGMALSVLEAGLAPGCFSCFPTFLYPDLRGCFRNILVLSASQQNKEIKKCKTQLFKCEIGLELW